VKIRNRCGLASPSSVPLPCATAATCFGPPRRTRRSHRVIAAVHRQPVHASDHADVPHRLYRFPESPRQSPGMKTPLVRFISLSYRKSEGGGLVGETPGSLPSLTKMAASVSVTTRLSPRQTEVNEATRFRRHGTGRVDPYTFAILTETAALCSSRLAGRRHAPRRGDESPVCRSRCGPTRR